MTLRARLLAGLIAVTAALSIAAVVVVVRQHQVLTKLLDDRLDLTVENSARLLRPGGPPGAGRPTVSDVYVGSYSAGVLTALVQSSNDPGLTPVVSADLVAQPGRHATVKATGGTSARMRVLIADAQGTTLVLGLPTTPVEDGFRDLLKTILITAFAVGLVVALLAWWILRLGLHPIRRMTETADAIVGGESSRRAPAFPAATEAGKLGLALNAMIDTSQQSEARLRRFVADASHELRTPLTTLRGYVHLYEQGGLRGDGELVDAMRRMSREAQRMGLMVDDLLLLAQLDEGRPFQPKPVDLAPILRDLAANVRVIQPARDVRLDIEGDLTVAGDETRLAQAMSGLVTNAWRHTPDNRAIVLTGRRVGNLVRVEVIDHGDGIAAEHLPRLFDRFYRVDAGRSRDRGGSGLGLSIVAAVIDTHGGTYGVESQLGTGSTFWLQLPASGLPSDTLAAIAAPST